MSVYTNPSYSMEEEAQSFIESRIEDFAQSLLRHGIDSDRLDRQDDDLVSVLYEYIEDNMDKFLPEAYND